MRLEGNQCNHRGCDVHGEGFRALPPGTGEDSTFCSSVSPSTSKETMVVPVLEHLQEVKTKISDGTVERVVDRSLEFSI